MATDPSLSDSNLPESSANLGFEDWTGSKGVLDKDITWLRDAFIKHLGQDYWNSRNEYPHPNQMVALVYFMEGDARLFPGGIQFVQTTTSAPPTISVVSDEFTDDPKNNYPNFLIAPNVYSGIFPKRFSIGMNLSGSSFSGIRGSETGTLGPYPSQLEIVADDGSYFGYFNDGTDPPDWVVIGAPLRWYGVTSDVGGNDGDTWYRTDTDQFRGRVNGVTVSFLHSGSVIVLSNLDVPFDAYSANQLLTSTNCFVTMDASGASRTFTLPSAATLGSGFTYVFKKIDSSNNTVTIDPNSTQTVDGVTTYVLTKQYETLCATSDGTNWVIWSAYNNELYVAQTATFTVGPRDTVISVSTAAGAVTANLPTAVGIAGREITIKKTTNDANFLTLDGSGSETIEGVSTYIITSIGEVTIYSNGANWLVKSESFGGYITRTTTYTTTITDRKVTANASGGAFTITLIAASSVAGERVMFRKIGTDTNLVTLDANSSETIDGAATLGLMTPGEWAELLSDGTNWLIVGYGS